MRMPVRPLPIQCFIFATASGATTSMENTPVKRSGMRRDRVRHVGIVERIGRRGLHQHGLVDAGGVIGRHHVRIVERMLGRPVRLLAEQRRQRIFLGVGGDDVAVGVDDHSILVCMKDAALRRLVSPLAGEGNGAS